MALIQFKNLFQIYAEKKATVQTIFPGANFVERSLILAVMYAEAIQQAEIHKQMANLLRVFSIHDAKGVYLERRALDYGLRRLSPRVSRGKVKFGDTQYTTRYSATLASNVSIGSGGVAITPGHNLPTTGDLGTIILSRGTASEEKLPITAVTSSLISWSGTTTYSHTSGDAIYRSTTGTDRLIPIGTTVSVKGLLGEVNTDYLTQETVTLLDGDVETDEVEIVSLRPGAATVVAAGQISYMQNPPFPTATVTQTRATSGGRDRESDEELLDRILDTLESLAKGTPRALENALVGLEVDTSIITRARAVEPVGMGATNLYIDDGSGGISLSSTVIVKDEPLILSSDVGRRRTRAENWPMVRGGETIHMSEYQGVPTAVGTNSLTDTGASWTATALIGHRVVDDQGAFWEVTNNTTTNCTLSPLFGGPDTPSSGSYAIYDPATNLTLFDAAQLPNTQPTASDHLIVNYSNGQMKLNELAYPSGMAQYGALVATNYSYATGIVAEAARIIQGDTNNTVDYPGEKATGTYVEITLPSIRNLSFTLQISVIRGYTESQLRPLVQNAIVQYVNARDLGATIYLSEIIKRVKLINGIQDVRITFPTTNPVLFENEIAFTDTSLIGVT